jgi:hypothetical protein
VECATSCGATTGAEPWPRHLDIKLDTPSTDLDRPRHYLHRTPLTPCATGVKASSLDTRQSLDRPRQGSTGLDRPRQPCVPRQYALPRQTLTGPDRLDTHTSSSTHMHEGSPFSLSLTLTAPLTAASAELHLAYVDDAPVVQRCDASNMANKSA